MQNPNIVIIGFGDIGRRVAAHYSATATQAWHRQSQTTPCDLDLKQYPALPKNALVFYFAPPQPNGKEDHRLKPLLDHWLSQKTLPQSLVMISTTGVYGDCQGRWVDESETLKPAAARAKRRTNAEVVLRSFAESNQLGAAVLRVPGIYASDRLPKKRLLSGEPILLEQDSPFSNRIHADDLASACVAAMNWAENHKSVEAFNISDDAPSSMTAYFNHVADYLGLAQPQQIPREQAERALSSGMLSYLNESKRIRNQKMKDVLGVQLRYPTLAIGLPLPVR